MSEIDKLLKDAKFRLEKSVESENYTDANIRQGHLFGIQEYIECYRNNSEALTRNRDFAEWNFAGVVKSEDYGKAAFWRAWINGWMQAETACRLDELTK